MKAFVTLILYQPLFNILVLLVWLIPGHNVGWAIVFLTILLRLALLPSSLKAARNQKHLQALQPEILKIQEQYKDDRQKQSQALMAFYKKNKISPLGSCLPALIQLPFLFVLYFVFKNGLDTSHFSLLYSWMPRPEAINTNFFGLDLTAVLGQFNWASISAHPELLVLPVLAGALQLINGLQTLPKTKPQQGQEMMTAVTKQMVYFMPLVTVFIAAKLPTALPLYWVITTLFSIGQQWWVSLEKDMTPKTISRSILKTSPQTIIKKGVEITVRKRTK